MIDDEDAELGDGVGSLDLSMRGWRTLDVHLLHPKLRRLRLEHNCLRALPGQAMGLLTYMVELDVSHNALEALPAALGGCVRLRKLNADHNNLAELPPQLGDCKFLEELYANHNRLKTVPASLGALQCLRVLELRTNKLEQLPYEIGVLETLEVLDCSGNDGLETIPPSMRGETALVKFCLRLNYDAKQYVVDAQTAYVGLQRDVQKREELNLRIRDAIEATKRDKQDLLRSVVPNMKPSQLCNLM
ncbi:hypothetical protein M885DRAFT_508403 [Pelagophyceae sp. CCMP2097]|nr:hypothetical protein M885DRAFT_508403 [Pelagophyceae sp. CCMP2097]